MNAEEWRPCVGFPLYDVSNLGRVRSRAGRWDKTPRVLSQCVNPQRGYLTVHVRRDGGKVVTMRVHRLVTEAFIGLRPEGFVTRHLNGDKSDNRLANLRYGTSLENAEDRRRLGEYPHVERTHCHRGHEFTPDNSRYWNGVRSCRACVRERYVPHPTPAMEVSDSVAVAAVVRFRRGETAQAVGAAIGVSDSLIYLWSKGGSRPHVALEADLIHPAPASRPLRSASAALSADCPTCGASAGSSCRSRSSGVVTGPHGPRLRANAAERAA